MPTLGYLVDERSELQLGFLEKGVEPYRETKVSLLAVAGEEELLRGRINVAQPPGAMLLLRIPGEGVDGALVAALDRLLPVLAKYRASGVVITVAEHSDLVLPPATRAAAAKLRIPLLTTTASSATWDGLHEGIRYCRVEYAERQVEKLTGLVSRLPSQWADATALASITDWLATALDAQVLISEPDRGVLAAAPDTAAEQLAHLASREAATAAKPMQEQMECAGIHTRLVAIAPTQLGDATLAVAADRPFDDADTRLITHAAKVLGLVDQAQREYATVTQSAREARAVTFQLLMNGEPAKARRVMAGLSAGLGCVDEARVYVIDCGSARHREVTMRRCEMATTGRALVVRCPRDERHIVIVEPMQDGGVYRMGIAADLQRLVLSLAGHRLGGSGHRPLAMVPTAHEEALTALRFTRHSREPYVLTAGHTDLVSLLEPGPAREWAVRLLTPLRQELSQVQVEQIEKTLSVAFSHPHTTAARLLDVHRNTVSTRLNRAADLLKLDLGHTYNRVVVGLALDLAAFPPSSHAAAAAAVRHADLADLLANPRVRAWAEALLGPLRAGRRDLTRTLTTWLEQNESVEKTAGSLGVAEATVRSHLKTIEGLTGRRLTTLPGLRDVTIALAVGTGIPIRSASHLAAA